VRIIEKPYDQFDLRSLSNDGRERVAGVVAIAWSDLLGRDQDQFEEEMCRRLTGSKHGLEDVGVKLVGCLGQDVFLEISGLVGTLLDCYEEFMAEEAGEVSDERGR
jgi:hypothetical protein